MGKIFNNFRDAEGSLVGIVSCFNKGYSMWRDNPKPAIVHSMETIVERSGVPWDGEQFIVYIVDDCSEDGSWEHIKARYQQGLDKGDPRWEGVVLKRHEENSGTASVLNGILGEEIKTTRGELNNSLFFHFGGDILILNPDWMMHPLETMLVNSLYMLDISGGDINDIWNDVRTAAPKGSTYPFIHAIEIGGACMIWRREITQRIGGFRTFTKRWGGDDADYALRAWRAYGGKIHEETGTGQPKDGDCVNGGVLVPLAHEMLKSTQKSHDDSFHGSGGLKYQQWKQELLLEGKYYVPFDWKYSDED